MQVLSFGDAGLEIVDTVGGVDQLFNEIDESVHYASWSRNYIPAHPVHIEAGAGGLVVKICFDDGICWADKMFTVSRKSKTHIMELGLQNSFGNIAQTYQFPRP